MVRVADVGDDRVQLAVADLPLGELRHQVRPDANRLRDLDVRGLVQRWYARARHDPARADGLVTARAVLRELLETLGERPLRRPRGWHRRSLPERVDVVLEGAHLARVELHAV